MLFPQVIAGSRIVPVAGRKRLGDILVARGLVSREAVDAALIVQKQTGLRLGQILIAADQISDSALVEVLSLQMDVPLVALAEAPADDNARELVSAEVARAHRAVPFACSPTRKLLSVAFEEPTEANIRSFERAAGMRVEAFLSTASEIANYAHRLYNWSPHKRAWKQVTQPGEKMTPILAGA